MSLIFKVSPCNVGIAAIHYNRQKIYIRAVLTHDEYDKGKLWYQKYKQLKTYGPC